jgi:hypothetical protein
LPEPTVIRPAALLLAVGLLSAAAVATTSVAPAQAATGTVTIANAAGTATADPDYATSITVTGSGFQSIQGGFGGIYALFGWVDADAAWQPSEGGEVGSDYRYVPDQEAKDNGGFQRFVAFPGSETEGAANAIMSPTGAFTVDMVVPGSTFESVDRSGDITSVDCLEVQCGVITIGAHGVKNANNETFTPISFVAPCAAAAPPAADAPAAGGATSARVGYTTQSAVAGNALSFTGQGFTAGEQVVATLDDGVAAVGPLTAGPSGEVAGVLQLPADLRAGTHLLSVRGAASGSTAESEVTVVLDAEREVVATVAEAPAVWPYLALGLGILVASTLLVVSIVTALVRRARGRKQRKSAASGALVEQAAR